MTGLAISTFGDLINLALKSGGVIGQGQTASAEDTNDTCALLNMMIGQWQRRRYLVYRLNEMSVACTGATSYSVGPGGDYNVSLRPSIINYAYALQTIGAGSPISYPVSIISSREDYARIAMKQLVSFPQWLWYDADIPLGRVVPYPVITSQFSLYIGFPEVIQRVSNLTDVIAMPPEYIEALLYNLAIRVSGNFNTPLNPIIVGLAKAATETMRTANAQIPTMAMPSILRGDVRYNIFSDRTNANY